MHLIPGESITDCREYNRLLRPQNERLMSIIHVQIIICAGHCSVSISIALCRMLLTMIWMRITLFAWFHTRYCICHVIQTVFIICTL